MKTLRVGFEWECTWVGIRLMFYSQYLKKTSAAHLAFTEPSLEKTTWWSEWKVPPWFLFHFLCDSQISKISQPCYKEEGMNKTNQDQNSFPGEVQEITAFFFPLSFFLSQHLNVDKKRKKRIVAVLFGVRMQNSETSPFQPNREFLFISETLWTRLCECVIFVFYYFFNPRVASHKERDFIISVEMLSAYVRWNKAE